MTSATTASAGISEAHSESRIAIETHAAIRELTRHRHQGSRQDAQVLNGRATLDRMLAEDLEHRQLRVRKITDLGELIESLKGVAARTQRELLSLHSGTVPTRQQLEASLEPDREMLERGVHLRVVYPTSFASIDYLLDYVREQTRLGVMYRFADAVPYRMVVSDGAHAMVPISTGHETLGAIITSEPMLVRPLRHLAHTMLRRGVEAERIDPADPRSGPSAIELKVIRVMAMGLTDDVAAKQLAVSERTFRRYVSTIMERLDAVSRFQAGVRAVERGWL